MRSFPSTSMVSKSGGLPFLPVSIIRMGKKICLGFRPLRHEIF